ncbi:MAG: ATP-binding cassette domain-containing protein [Rhodanobacter sp.]|nr:MAG: ATP-binding cassette domain-containing protein [Rhodanobacter sp.]TAM15031.1 MAG: ATP-binding cassette domain-containing protein [Rhodanobacter sp.]TAM36499.1 MAG: ATP-binding cassette domain-containing protein [Rhodanobacter sp.]
MTDQPTPLHPALLDASHIALSYGRHGQVRYPVLRDFSLQLRAGEIVAVLGPSGAGKSSLLRVLGGLQKPDRGSVRVRGEVLHDTHPRVSLMFQDPCLLPWLTLEENVGFGLDFARQPVLDRNERRRRVHALIDEVGLTSALGRYPSELSGGMAQRVALARSLVRRPELLLLDEPFSALDEITRGEMQQLLLVLAKRSQTAAVLVTHDIDEALLLADRILLLGGVPAELLGEWTLAAAQPRDAVSGELTRMRVDIVQALRAARTDAPAAAERAVA